MLRPSLKWRIAAIYSLLLIVVLSVTSFIILVRSQDILWELYRSQSDHVVNEIVAAAETNSNPFSVNAQSTDPAQALMSDNLLAYWESPTIFIQVDNGNGYPLNKSSNLGVNVIPPNHALSPKNDTAYRQVQLASRPFLVEDKFVTLSNHATIVHVATPLDSLYATVAQTRQAISLVLMGAIGLVIVLSFFLAAQVTAPINLLAETMGEIGSEELGRRVSLPGRKDEVGQLAQSFNDLLARLEEAFARERQFISDASHELKTPLTSINANAQMLLRWGDKDPTVLHESLETIAAESATLAGMVNGMLTLAKADRGDSIPKEPVSMALIAQEAVRSASSRASEKGLNVELDLDAGSPIVYGDEALLRQLVTNLIDNAIKFTPAGFVRVRVRTTPLLAIIEVEDSGPGIAADELNRVFERFYRSDRARSREVAGTGLGLAIVRSIARVHNGNVVAEAAPGGGALFRITLPRISLTEAS